MLRSDSGSTVKGPVSEEAIEVIVIVFCTMKAVFLFLCRLVDKMRQSIDRGHACQAQKSSNRNATLATLLDKVRSAAVPKV